MRQRGRENRGLRSDMRVVPSAHSESRRTVCLRFRVDTLLADDLQLLRRDAMDQPIFFVDRLRSNGLEGGRGHREGKGRKAGFFAT